MNDSVSILVAVFFILIAIRWMLGGNQGNQQHQQQGQRRTTVGRRQHRVTPQMIEMVRSMFPDIPIPAIQADLQRTGSVETTVDNALRDGGLPLPANYVPQQGSPSSSNNNNNTATSSASSSIKSPSHPSLIQRYKIDVQKQESEPEPPKVWEASPDKRQEALKKRKEFMVLQARKRLMEQQQKKKEEELAKSEQEVVSTEDKSVDDMSVDELNSLSPEERRNHMLKALEKRTTPSSSQ